MKKLFSWSFFILFSTVLVLQLSVSSCSKDKTIYDTINKTVYDTITQIKKDTVIIKDTAISLQLLTANSWKTQELIGVIANTPLYYERGGSSNTENYDNEYITFNSDKTGILFDAAGTTHPITWDFLNSSNTKLTFTVLNPPPIANQTVIYDNLRYKNGALLFDEYWNYNSSNSHAQGIRIPK